MTETITCWVGSNSTEWFLDGDRDFGGRESWRYILALTSPRLFTFIDHWVTAPPKWPFWRSVEEIKHDVNHHTFTFENRPLIYASEVSENIRRDCNGYLKAALQIFAEDKDIASYIETCGSVADLYFNRARHQQPHSIEYINRRLNIFSCRGLI